MIKLDLHMHSVASHAINTLYELAKEASEKSVELIAITEHGPSMNGAPIASYFDLVPRIPSHLYGVRILKGCEANIINSEGDIDINQGIIKKLDIVLAGLHDETPFPEGKGSEYNTNAIIACVNKGLVDIISHPFKKIFPTDTKKIVKCASNYNVALELNSSIFKEYDSQTYEATKEMLDLCKEYGVPIAVNSDAHIACEIGDDSNISPLFNLEHLDIINRDSERLNQFFKKRRERK